MHHINKWYYNDKSLVNFKDLILHSLWQRCYWH